ncbi:hypothetical protein BS17DRAFT_781900 [Gyrodon lividus]|nr:hypothetical protein BS17DRAFT_781900 [Gyrodon lividus]
MSLMSSSPESQAKHEVSYRGLLVGCFGSPSWETRLKSKLDKEARQQQQRSSFMYRLHMDSRRRHPTRPAYANSKPKKPSSSPPLTRSTSFFSFSSEASIDDGPASAMSFLPLRLPTFPGDSSRRPVQQKRSSWHNFYVGGLGEIARAPKLPEAYDLRIRKRTSQSSVRLVDGHGSNHVNYPFLSGLPPQPTLRSPLMGTRDSLQLSRHPSRLNRKPVPPLPPLPSYQPLVSKRPCRPAFGTLPTSEYLPPLQFSPPTNITNVFHFHQQILDEKVSNTRAFGTNRVQEVVSPNVPCRQRILDFPPSDASQTRGITTMEPPASPFVVQGVPLIYAVQKMNRKPNHKRSRSRNGAAPGASPLRFKLALIPDNTADVMSPLPGDSTSDKENSQSRATTVLRTPSASSHSNSTTLKQPLKSSLWQDSIVSTHSICSPDSVLGARFTVAPPISGTRTRTFSQNMEKQKLTDDQASLRTPVSEVDIGMLGLDRFHWNDESEELKERPSHMKQDSLALISFWQEAQL